MLRLPKLDLVSSVVSDRSFAEFYNFPCFLTLSFKNLFLDPDLFRIVF